VKELFRYYSIGDFINQSGNPTEFEVMRFDEIDEPEVDDLHKHTFYEIIWIEKGRSRQVIDHTEYEITPGSLFFISPGQLHVFEEWRPVSGGCVMFTENFFLFNYQNKDKLFELTFLDNFYGNPVLKPSPSTFREIKETIDLLTKEKKRKDYSVTLAQALLHVLLCQIQRCIDSKSKTTTSKKYIILYKNFKNLIDLHFTENLSVTEYASKLSITQHHLNFITKTVTGKTATEVIRTRYILEAKRLLTFSDYSVSEVASLLGFFDSSYFAKIFKAETGITPLGFKSSISDLYRKM
jgi:AraC family transcriptional regulator, transcriptional activator of pobA